MARVVRPLLVQVVDTTLDLLGPQSAQRYLDLLQRAPKRPGFLGRLRQILMNLPSTGDFCVPIESDGLVFVYCTDRSDSFNLYCRMQFADYEPETRKLFRIVAARSDSTLDVGAYSGLYSLEAAVANPLGRVWAFEPMASSRNLLVRNLEVNGLSDRVVVSDVALSDVEGSIVFFLNSEQASSTRASLLHWEGDQMRRTTEVRTLPLDSVLLESPLRVDLMKLDVEGAESRVLGGAAKTIEASKPVLFTEALSDHALAVQFSQLALHGYGDPLAVISANVSDSRNFVWIHPKKRGELLPILGRSLAPIG